MTDIFQELQIENQKDLVVSDKKVEERLVNSGPFNFFMRKDPTDGKGYALNSFGVSLNYAMSRKHRDKLQYLKEELSAEIMSMFEGGKLGNIKASLVDYQDKEYILKEEKRRYIEIECETVRGTLITTLVRFYTRGDNFYIALDSYVLGSLSWISFLFRSFVSYATVSVALFLIPLSLITIIFPFLIAFSMCRFLYWEWGSVMRNFSSGIKMALRQRFQKPLSDSSFDIDDAVIFLKSSSPVILRAVQRVFKRHDIEIEGLEKEIIRIEQQVTNNTITNNSINNTNGIISGVANVGKDITNK